jgi:hypothetical protein
LRKYLESGTDKKRDSSKIMSGRSFERQKENRTHRKSTHSYWHTDSFWWTEDIRINWSQE